ncbi:hypothetical protein [Falsihalocynthiibacter sp. CO-5D18]|uniref:hypothetical protein n=2 Tax=unclassified Falsihalocynthiibacter TaxID=2854191 RepID=UPI00350F6A42
MSGQPTDSKSKSIQIEDFEGGRRFIQGRVIGFSFGKLFGISFGVLWIGLGLMMPFLSEATAPGIAPMLKIVTGSVMVLFGVFIVYAVRRNIGRVLEVDLANRSIRAFVIDNNNRRRAFREIAFQNITGVFSEFDESELQNTNCSESLIINYRGWPGRLYALSGRSEQMAMVRDFILTEALHRQPALIVDGVDSFIAHTKWALKQRMKWQ